MRGPNQTCNLGGFSGIAQARSAAQTILGHSRYGYGGAYSTGSTSSSNITTYSVCASAVGTGKNARVTISKTKDWYQRHVQSKEVYKRELQAVKALRQ